MNIYGVTIHMKYLPHDSFIYLFFFKNKNLAFSLNFGFGQLLGSRKGQDLDLENSSLLTNFLQSEMFVTLNKTNR